MRSYRRSSAVRTAESQTAPARVAVSWVTSLAGTPLYRNGYALTLNALSNSVLGMVYWILAAHFYSTVTVGMNSAAISAMMFLAGVAQLNMVSGVLRYIPGAGKASARFVTTAYIVSVAVAAVISLVFLHGLVLWSPTLGPFGTSPALAVWFTISTMAWCIFVLQDSVLTGLRQAVWVPVENAVFGVAKIAVLIGLARLVPKYGLYASWTIGMAITLFPVNTLIFRHLIPAHLRQIRGPAEPLIPAQIVRFVAVDYVGSLCWLASTTLLPLLVTAQAGATANAYYYLSWQIAFLLYSVSTSMGSSLIVEAVKAIRNWSK